MEQLAQFIQQEAAAFATKLVSFHSILSIPSLLSALLIAALFYSFRRGVHLRALRRVVLPARLWRDPSVWLDVKYLLANSFIFPPVVAWAVLTRYEVDYAITSQLTHVFGAPVSLGISADAALVITIFVLYMAYELAYFIDHYLAHKIPALWEFHKVHHSATTLTPLTNWRVHPIDTIVFFNIMALVMGSLHALSNYLLGITPDYALLMRSSVVVLVAFYLYGHLQHSHVWMPLTGRLGNLIASPAHHQIHHSMLPQHFDRNFGHTLVLWDWAFGTLCKPHVRRERFTVGVHDDAHLKTFFVSIIAPFAKLWGLFK